MRLSCNSVTVAYGTGRIGAPVLKDLSFETQTGEFLCILGPSGCGKTTLLRTIAGALKPASGGIELVPTFPEEPIRPLLVRQENALFPWMTALDNACFGLAMQGVAKPEREQRALELFERYGLAQRQDAYPSQLSLGMKQRVALIRGFLSNPSLLLMDEPFAALDAQARLLLQQELLALWESREHVSVVFVTHDVEEALLLGDRVIVLSGRPAEIVADLRISIPRPRTAAATMTAEFLRMKATVLGHLGVELPPMDFTAMVGF